jgi:hypothetical protein
MKRPAGSSRHSLRVAFLALVVFAQPTRADDASDRRDLIRSIENEDSRWRDADGIKRDMDQWRDYARRFGETDGKWSNGRSELHTSADEVYGEWNKSWKLAEQQCANLRRGTDHPKIDAAMRELARFSKGREEIIKEAEGYLDAAASLLSGADRHSDDRNIAAALLKGDDIGRSLAKLGYAKGGRQARQRHRREVAALRRGLQVRRHAAARAQAVAVHVGQRGGHVRSAREHAPGRDRQVQGRDGHPGSREHLAVPAAADHGIPGEGTRAPSQDGAVERQRPEAFPLRGEVVLRVRLPA